MLTLDAYLDSVAASDDASRGAVAATVRALTAAAIAVHGLVGEAGSGGSPEPDAPEMNGGAASGDAFADAAGNLFLDAARGASVAFYASETAQRPVMLGGSSGLALAVGALSGPSGLGGVPAGSVFSVLPASAGPQGDPESAFRQPGSSQLAAGLFVYGHPLTLVLTARTGTHSFAFSPRLGGFAGTGEPLAIPLRADDVAVDMSAYRHWREGLRLYVDDCLEGADGPRERDFTVGWSGAPAAEAARVLRRGGVFVSPADNRKGHARGLLRLVHEANPLALLAEEAGGAASDTVDAILDRVPESLNERTPLAFGAAREVARIARYGAEPSLMNERTAERAPLFGHRGLFRR